jgi:DNA-binding protein HU-beta
MGVNESMNKSDLVDLIIADGQTSRTAALRTIETIMSGITSALKKGNHVTLSGFGSFSTYQRKARNGRNPQTGELIKLPSRRVVKFSPGTELKEAVGRK